jgi:hypothetical protein
MAITIPVPIVPHAREGAIYLLGLAADDIGKESDRATPELEAPLQRFDAARTLLDALPDVASAPIDIGDEHRQTLLDALWDTTAASAGLAESAAREGDTELAWTRAGEVEDLSAYTARLSMAGEAS